MTFISDDDFRAMRDARKAKTKYETPDRPGTNLAYVATGKRPESAPKTRTALADALARAGVESGSTGARVRIRKGKAVRVQPRPGQGPAAVNPAVAMRRIAEAGGADGPQ